MMPLSQHPNLADHVGNPLAPAPQMTGQERSVLNSLRMAAMGCRVAARTDLFEACALLTVEGEDAKRTFVDTFVRCLSATLNKRIKWHSPGVTETSFDEAWVMRCLTSIWEEDNSSLTFLLTSRVPLADRRYIGFLLGRISEQFPRN